LLVGAAAIEVGEPAGIVLERLARANPEAAQRSAQNVKLRAERKAKVDELLRTRFGVEPDTTQGGPLLPAARHFELARALKEELGYRCYVTVCASHSLAQKAEPERFEVATVLRAVGPGTLEVAWRVQLAPGEAIDSLVSLFAGADWQEREQFDLLGVQFRGHPDLRRLMLPEEWEGHPIRKDYAIDTRCVPWR
jgi:NADH-quinone oxidoreductase subunit C